MLNLKHPWVSQIIRSCTSPGIRPYISSIFFSPSVLHISQIKKIIIYFLDQSNEESSTFLYNIYIIKEHNKIKLNWSLKTKGNNSSSDELFLVHVTVKKHTILNL